MRNDQILHNIQCLGMHMYTLDYTGLSTKSINGIRKKNSEFDENEKQHLKKRNFKKMKKIFHYSKEDKVIINITYDFYIENKN